MDINLPLIFRGCLMLSLRYSLKNGSIVYWGQQKVSPQGIVLCIKISVLSSLPCNISNDTNKKGLIQIVPVLFCLLS